MGKNIDGTGEVVDISKIKDLNNEDELFAQMQAEGNIIMDQAGAAEGGKDDEDEKEKKKRKRRTQSQKALEKIEEDSFARDLHKAGGI